MNTNKIICESGQSASLLAYNGIMPKIHPTAFLCEGVRIIGDVEIGENVSVWYNTVIRGDVNYIRIGDRSNIQDLSMLHVTNHRYPLIIANDVSIAHSVSLHGAVIKENCLIGIGASVLDGAIINPYCLIAAGAIVREGFEVPERSLVAGVPGKVIRELTDKEIERITNTPPNYIKYATEYRRQFAEATGK
jgi:carbonic anhydrase/acetyltransferase-like protein (isoleucine patch superfamily)